MFGNNTNNRKNNGGFGSSSAPRPTFSFGGSSSGNQNLNGSVFGTTWSNGNDGRGFSGNAPTSNSGGNHFGGAQAPRENLALNFNFGGSSNSTVRAAKQIAQEKDENLRTEFQDLMKMMKLLEISEKNEKDAKTKMDSCDEKYELASKAFKEKKEAREQSQSNLSYWLTNVGTGIAEDKENTGKAILQQLEIFIKNHYKIIDEEEISKQKMEENKKALDETTAEYLKKKEQRDQVQNDLSSSFTDAAKDLVHTE